MSAGYVICSLDWDKFQRLVERPKAGQLTALAKLLRCELKEQAGEFDDDDPMAVWPTGPKALAGKARERLARQDWYGDLSPTGRSVWEGVVFRACMKCRGIDVGFRVDNDGVYWDVIEIAWKRLGVVPGSITDVAMSTFGTRPYRCHAEPKPRSARRMAARGQKAVLAAFRQAIDEYKAGPRKGRKTSKAREVDEAEVQALPDLRKLFDPKRLARKFNEEVAKFLSMPAFAALERVADEDDDLEEWVPMHSMHPPDEVRRMLSELKSIQSRMKTARDREARTQFENDLMPAIGRVAADGRLLFIKVDT
jgi:hypothetical protein